MVKMLVDVISMIRMMITMIKWLEAMKYSLMKKRRS